MKEVRDLFNLAGKNRDGKLDMAEFIAYVFGVDKDKDGVLTEKECRDWKDDKDECAL